MRVLDFKFNYLSISVFLSLSQITNLMAHHLVRVEAMVLKLLTFVEDVLVNHVDPFPVSLVIFSILRLNFVLLWTCMVLLFVYLLSDR